jgi:hypothetical protein
VILCNSKIMRDITERANTPPPTTEVQSTQSAHRLHACTLCGITELESNNQTLQTQATNWDGIQSPIMKTFLALTILTISIGQSHSLERPRQLRKEDYGYNGSSGKSGKSTGGKSSKSSVGYVEYHHDGSGKSSKSSGRSSKSRGSSGSEDGHGYEGYYDNAYSDSDKGGRSSSKSGKSGSKSSKSSSESSKNSDYSSDIDTDDFDGDAKAAKFHDDLEIVDDDDVFTLDYGDDGLLNSNSFEVEEGDHIYYDVTVDDSIDDAPANTLDTGTHDTTAESSETDGEEEEEVPLDQNSWLTDLISGKEPTDDDFMSMPAGGFDLEYSMSIELEDETLDQSSWLTDLISGKEPTDDDFMSMSAGGFDLEYSMSIKLEGETLDQNSWLTDMISGKEPTDDDSIVDDDLMSLPVDLELNSMSLKLDDETLDQNSWLTDLISGDEPADDDDSMSISFESTVLVIDDEVLDLELVTSMSMQFGFFLSMDLLDDGFHLNQADIGFGSMSMALSGEENSATNSNSSSPSDAANDEIEVGEKDSTSDPNLGGDDAVESNSNNSGGSDGNTDSDDSAAENNGTDSNNANNNDDGITDDGTVDDSREGTSNEEASDYLSQDERTQIILEKCNTTPLGRALSLIQIIGNQVDPQG